MPLIPYEPFRQLETIRRDLDRFFSGISGYGQELNIPRIDVYETEKEVVASCEIPGLEKKDDVNIAVDNNILVISGTINKINEVKEEHMHRRERYVGRFQRAVHLPTSVSAEGTMASYRNGVLEIRIPKAIVDTKKRIDVEFH